MTIEQDIEHGVRVFTLAGRVDSATAPELEAALDAALQAGERHVLLDCAQLDYFTSAGLKVLLVYGKQLETGGGRLAFSSVNHEILTVFNLTNFSLLYPVYGSRQEGIEALARRASGQVA